MIAFILAVSLQAQAPLTVDQAVARALERYAGVKVSETQIKTAAQGINLARTAYLPQADFLSQVNRATRNNIFGMVLPQSTLPNISGPPLANNSMTNVWGTATGFLVSWEPFDFGLRQAKVDAASAVQRHAEATLEKTKYEVASAAADAFLTVLAAEQTVKGAEAAVKRARAVAEIINAQVKAELRPGVDQTRMQAEIAMAEAQQIQAEQAVAMAKASLAQFTGDVPALAAGRLLEPPPDSVLAQADPANHPVAKEQATAIDEAKARQKVADKSWAPRFNLQGTTYARGSGANADFTTGGAASGLGPNIVNWGAGLTVTFPVLSLPGIRVQREIEAGRTRTEQARHEQLLQDLTAREARARAQFEGARRLVTKLPAQLEAARQAETQATARYKAGLNTVIDVADSQRLLAQSEIDVSLANLAIWRAMLAISIAQGDLKPFLAAAH